MTDKTTLARILAIAGSDSSGGAGIQADIKTITSLGGYAMTAITAITAQNTTGVQGVELPGPDMVVRQIESCLSDIRADAVKIGMLGSADIAHRVSDLLKNFDGPVVLDPVMIATSGAILADSETIRAFEQLMLRADLITPNLPELAVLAAMPADNPAAIIEAASKLAQKYGCAVLAKGGHGAGDEIIDILIEQGGPERGPCLIRHPRIDSVHTHGTGCTLSSAIATFLGQGVGMEHAVRQASDYVHRAICLAPGFGAGHGPLNHMEAAIEDYGRGNS